MRHSRLIDLQKINHAQTMCASTLELLKICVDKICETDGRIMGNAATIWCRLWKHKNVINIGLTIYNNQHTGTIPTRRSQPASMAG